MVKSRKPFSLQLKSPKFCNFKGLKAVWRKNYYYETQFFFEILKAGCLSVDWIPKLILKTCPTMEQKLVQRCETEVLATVSHSWKGKNILCNHDSWLQRLFFPLQPWLMVAKRLNSWDFTIIFIKISWLLKICIYLWTLQKRANLFLILQTRFAES